MFLDLYLRMAILIWKKKKKDEEKGKDKARIKCNLGKKNPI